MNPYVSYQDIKKQVKTLPHYYVLQYLIKHLNVDEFEFALKDRITIKVKDKYDEVGYFSYDDMTREVVFSEEEIPYQQNI